MNKHLRQLCMAWALLGFGFTASLWGALHIKQGIEADAARQFDFICDQVALKIRERLGAYALTLRGGVGLFNASMRVTRDDWRIYTETLRAQDSIPGVQGIGFAKLIKPEALAEHIADIRREGFPEYRVYPSGERGIYSAIVYLEPFRDRNLRAFGYDMFSEPTRRQAMEQARDSGDAALSGKVELVQETGTEIQAGTLMYMPVYRGGITPPTLDQRRAALIGWVYSPYRMNDLLEGILGDWEHQEGRDIRIRVYAGAQMIPANLLFASKVALASELDSASRKQRIVEFNGRQWLLVLERTKTQPMVDYAAVWAVLAGGTALSGLLFGLMRATIDTRKSAARIADGLIRQIRSREQKIAEAEARWRFALESSGDGVWDWDIVNDKVFYSRRWKEMLGFTEHEIGNDSSEWSKRIHPEDRAETFKLLEAHFNNRIPIYATEFRVIGKDGNIKWILARGTVIERDADGKPLRIIGTHTDVTLRKLLEESLRQNQHELLEAQRIARVGSWKLDLKTLDVRWSDELFKMFGMPVQSDAPGFDRHIALFNPDSWAKLDAAITNTRETGAPYELELQLRREDGGQGWMLVRGEAERDAGGSIVALRGVAADITERKQLEITSQTEHRDHQRVLDALDALPAMVYWKDLNACYRHGNRTVLAYFGCTLEELVGADDARFFLPQSIERLRESDGRVFAGGNTLEKIEIADRNGFSRVLLTVKAPLYDESGQISGLMGIAIDMTAL